MGEVDHRYQNRVTRTGFVNVEYLKSGTIKHFWDFLVLVSYRVSWHRIWHKTSPIE